MQASIDRSATFGWTKDVDWDEYAAELDHDAPEPQPRRVIRGRGRWGVGIDSLPTPVKGCGVRAIDHHMKHSPSAKQDYRHGTSDRKRDKKKKKKKKREKYEKRENKKEGEERGRKAENKKKKRSSKKNERCKGRIRMTVDDVSRQSRHDNYHRLRLRKIRQPQLQAKLSFSALSLNPSNVDAAASDLNAIGFIACLNMPPPSQCYVGPLAGLVAATKCLGEAFLPDLKPRTVSDDFEVLSRAFPQNCNILNEKTIISSITMFRHASSDHHRARPAAMLRNSDGRASHVPLIILPDIDEHGVPKLGVILAESVAAVGRADHRLLAHAVQLDPLQRTSKLRSPSSSHKTLLREMNGPTPRLEKLGSSEIGTPKSGQQKTQVRFGRGASTNPLVGLRSPAQSYCRSSRPAKGVLNNLEPIRHPQIWGFALSP
jgi:hypothetical protein